MRKLARSGISVIAAWTVVSSITIACRPSTVGAPVSDQEFWNLTVTLSEPPGIFSVSENLVSNEPHVSENARWLHSTGGVYVGVGPEQNFSYIATLRPSTAFIIDIRRENLDLHLMYKALFELSTDRVEFVSRLFSRPRPANLASSATVDEIFSRLDGTSASPDQYRTNAALIRQRLLTFHRFPLSETDLQSIDHAFSAFYSAGVNIDFWGSRGIPSMRRPYRDLMTTRDSRGHSRSFLATEEGFRFVKDLHSRNRIIPVVGDFGGPDAIREVGDYVREHQDVIRAFYGSNVGVYLNSQQKRIFCRNLAMLPAAPDAWFIESDGVGPITSKLKACAADSR